MAHRDPSSYTSVRLPKSLTRRAAKLRYARTAWSPESVAALAARALAEECTRLELIMSGQKAKDEPDPD